MAAKSSISLVSVQKPTANTPILQRRNKLTANIDQQIIKIGSFREGKRISREQFWVDNGGAIYFHRQLLVLLARLVAHYRSEMHHRIHASHCLHHRADVAHISAFQFAVRMLLRFGQWFFPE